MQLARLARAWIRSLAVAALGAGALLVASPVGARADGFIDVRGDWDELTSALGTTFAQTLHFTHEDFTTGTVSGTDTTSSATARVSGQLSGNVLQLNISEPGYTSTGAITISGSGTALTFTGVFVDSNGTRGTATGRLARVAYRTGGGGDIPVLAQSLRSLGEVSFKPVDLARSAILAAGLMVLIGFPGSLFNSTLQSHYEEVMGWFAFLRRRRRDPDTDPQAPPAEVIHETNWLLVGALFVFMAVVGAYIDPAFGFNLTSFEAVLGNLGGILVTTFVYTGFSAWLQHRVYGRWGYFRVFRGGVVLACVCVAVSKVSGAQPGYIYGVILGYTLDDFEIPKAHAGRLVATGYALVLMVSLLAWALWTPVKTAAATSTAIPLIVTSSILAGIAMGGMSSMVFGLLPLRFLDGQTLLSWQRALWVAIFGIGMFLFVHVVLNSTAASAQGRSYTGAIVFFAIFGLISVSFWAYFRYRPEPILVAAS